MTIIIHKRELTDGSGVFDVQLLDGKDSITLHPGDESTARRVASEIRDAVNDCLGIPIEWMMDY